MEATRQPRLPIAQVMGTAWSQIQQHHVPLLKACAGPIGLMALGSLPLGFPLLGLLQLVLYNVGSALLFISCHRILLLGAGSLPSEWGLYFSGRELRYMIYVFIAAVVAISAMAPVMILAIFAPWFVVLPMFFAFLVGLLYASARIFPLFTGVAVDQAWTLRACLSITRDHGWPLALLFLAAGLLTGIPGLILLGLGTLHPLLGWLLSIPIGALGVYTAAVTSFAFLYVCPVHLRPVRVEGSRDGEGPPKALPGE